MYFDPFKHHRKSYRYKNYDYTTQGAYFVTICTNNREYLFGNILDRRMHLSTHGQIIKNVWDQMPNHFSSINLDEFIIMPNHVHGIIQIVGAQFIAPSNESIWKMSNQEALNQGVINHAPTVGEIIRYFKGKTAYLIQKQNQSIKVWQRNYHERIIRTEYELENIRYYIRENPRNWEKDPEKFRRGAIYCAQ
ncbi:MAG: transposase [Deltaproteobacteria bacterium]|nr:MAG: transposase [Deltaproteobacteria bacterium]